MSLRISAISFDFSVARPSDAIGGEGSNRRDQSISWKPASEFTLRDEDKFDDDFVQVISTVLHVMMMMMMMKTCISPMLL